MIIPLKVDVPQERLPIVNWIIIAAIIGAFLLQRNQISNDKTVPYNKVASSSEIADSNSTPKPKPKTIEEMKEQIRQKWLNRKWRYPFEFYMLNGWNLKGMLGYMWLHGGIIHIVGNLIFLWIFGNAVCSKIGNIAYAPIYIFLGLFAALSHLIFSGGPAWGASGAINGIVGMFLILFPLNSITCLWSITIIYWRTFETSSYWIILMWFVFDIFGAVMGGGNVAYFAHLGGFVAGVAIAIVFLKSKIITMTRYEKSLPDIFSERCTKTAPQEPFYNRAILREQQAAYPENLAQDSPQREADISVAPISLPILGSEDFFSNNRNQTETLSLQQLEVQSNDGFIRFHCECGKRVKVPAKFAGKTGKCPKCEQRIQIPQN